MYFSGTPCTAALIDDILNPLFSTLTDDAVRLIDGSNEIEGRLEIYHKGEWGTVCNDDFNVTDSNVVCRQLGFGIASHTGSQLFESGRYTLVLIYRQLGRYFTFSFIRDKNKWGKISPNIVIKQEKKGNHV